MLNQHDVDSDDDPLFKEVDRELEESEAASKIPIAQKPYNYAFLTVLNDAQPIASSGLADQLVRGANKILSDLFEADDKLKQYFFEMILVAYRRDITGPENLFKFLELTWKVSLRDFTFLPTSV